MNDEKYTFIEDCREKKHTARSYYNRVTHGGKVRLPSDHLTKKELKAMSGEVKSYKLNDPMTWAEFKALPDDLKAAYIKAIRERYKVSDRKIFMEMFGVSQSSARNMVAKLGIGVGRNNYHSGSANLVEWEKWLHKDADTAEAKESEHDRLDVDEAVPTEVPIAISTEDVTTDVVPAVISEALVKASESLQMASEALYKGCDELEEAIAKNAAEPITPGYGMLELNGNAKQVLETIGMILNDAKVKLSVTWTVVTDNG